MLELYDLKIENQKRSLCIDTRRPAFSWKLSSDLSDTKQKGYQIIVRNGEDVVFDTGTVASEQSLYIPYEGKPLEEKTSYIVEVCVTDSHDQKAKAEIYFETALFDTNGFEAKFITHGFEETMDECAVFFKDFSLSKKVTKARIYVTSLGIYSVKINDKKISEDLFTPGWTSYQKRLQYQVYDVSELLKEDNRIEATVADGWYKGILGFYNQGNHYGKATAFFCQLEVIYEDGSKETICTDESWSSTKGEHRYGQIYHGQIIDRSLGKEEVKGVKLLDYPKENLVAQQNEPVRITQRLKVKEVLHAPNGETLLDFGQNMTGIIELKTKQARGTKIVLKHGEMLDENGNLFTTNLRTAKATDTFICSGQDDVFLPEFTFHGFRYVAVEGLDVIDPDQFTACVLHSDFERGNSFTCDNKDVDRLWKNIDWTMRSNYFDVPMDCPQRDERLGYTGDAQIFLPTALFHADLSSFYRKWLEDLKVEQSFGFGVPLTVPDILRTHVCVNIWHDAATIVPWKVYETYGDLRLLKDQYDSMKDAVEFTRNLCADSVLLNFENSSQFGDWVALDYPKGPYRKPEAVLHPSQDEKGGGTDMYLIGNVYYLNSIDILVRSAKLLHKDEDAKAYENLYNEVLKAFKEEYISRSGRVVSQTQTAAALVLYFNLCDESQRPAILKQLQYDLIKTKKHLRTGFVGTEYLPSVLSDNGLHELAGDILMKEDCPSWLYEVKLGATTVWELWDGVNPDHSINPFVMNSFNQYGFASIGDWLIKKLAGVSPLEAGYHKTLIRPRLIKGISSLAVSYNTPYGKLSMAYSCKNRKAQLDVTIPENTTALIDLIDQETMELGSGTYHFEYDCERSYELQTYSEDTTLRQLMKIPAVADYFEQKAPQLKNDPLINNFAGRMSIIEIKTTLPKTMVPEYAYAIFDEMIKIANGKEIQ